MDTMLQQRHQRYGGAIVKRASNKLMLLITLLLSISSIVIVTGQNDPCNFCRAPNVVNNPDAAVTSFVLQLLGINNDFINCGDLDTIGQSGAFTDRVCLLLQSRPTLRRSCGCALPGAPFQPPPARSPTRQPATSTDDASTIDDDAADDDATDDDATDDDASISDDDDSNDDNDGSIKDKQMKKKESNMMKKKNSDNSFRR